MVGQPQADAMGEIPGRAIRVVVRDSEDRILLLRTRELSAPELGEWWELPGGGVEDGEDHARTAVRELHEETGIAVSAAQVSQPTWRRRACFRHRQLRYLQDEQVVLVRLDRPGHGIDGSGRLDYEHEDYVDFRWWPIDAVVASRERFYPGRLPELLARFLSGERIDEPFEMWS